MLSGEARGHVSYHRAIQLHVDAARPRLRQLADVRDASARQHPHLHLVSLADVSAMSSCLGRQSTFTAQAGSQSQRASMTSTNEAPCGGNRYVMLQGLRPDTAVPGAAGLERGACL